MYTRANLYSDSDKVPMMTISPWYDVLADAQNEGKRVSVLVNGSYKPYTGRVLEIKGNLMIALGNEYAQEYILFSEIKAVRVYC